MLEKNRTFDVTASLNYSQPINDHSERWYIDTISCPNGTKRSNFENHRATVTITDLRGREHLASLDTTGFQTFYAPTTFNSDLLLTCDHHCIDNPILAQYFNETENILQNVTDADKVVIFDHTFRMHNPSVPETPLQREPVLRVHVDQNPFSAHDRITYHVEDKYKNFKRFQLINVWRPIKNIVYDYPLAFADFRTVNVEDDLIDTELRYPPWLEDKETFAVKYNPMHKWYYWSHMEPDELIMFKCYDSFSSKLANAKMAYKKLIDGKQLEDVAGLALHTAFFNKTEAEFKIKRQSIEVRAIVLHM